MPLWIGLVSLNQKPLPYSILKNIYLLKVNSISLNEKMKSSRKKYQIVSPFLMQRSLSHFIKIIRCITLYRMIVIFHSSLHHLKTEKPGNIYKITLEKTTDSNSPYAQYIENGSPKMENHILPSMLKYKLVITLSINGIKKGLKLYK